MNILYLCDEYPPGQHGGIGTSVRLIARQMVKLGHKVVVAGLYTPGYGGDNEFEDDGVKVYRFRRRFDTKWINNPQSLAIHTGNYLLKHTGLMEQDIKKSLELYKAALEKIIVDHKIDLIEMPDYNDYIRFCRSYIPFPVLPVPVIVKMHGSITYFTKEVNKQVPAHIFNMEQTILSQAAAIASVSKYTANKSAIYFSCPDKIEVLYNGIETGLSAGSNSKNIRQVAFTGALVSKKGIYQLAKAWNIVNRNMPDARLIILGKGDQKKVISCLTAKARSSVLLMGHVTAKKLYNYLGNSMVSVFPSYAEAFALAPLEAMACGTAVINSNRTSGPELIADHINGLLINPDDIEQMAASVLYLLNNPAICTNLAKNGRETVKTYFDINKIATQNIQFYNRVLQG